MVGCGPWCHGKHCIHKASHVNHIDIWTYYVILSVPKTLQGHYDQLKAKMLCRCIHRCVITYNRWAWPGMDSKHCSKRCRSSRPEIQLAKPQTSANEQQNKNKKCKTGVTSASLFVKPVVVHASTCNPRSAQLCTDLPSCWTAQCSHLHPMNPTLHES